MEKRKTLFHLGFTIGVMVYIMAFFAISPSLNEHTPSRNNVEGGIIQVSGSTNSKIWVTALNNESQPQNGTYLMSGYVERIDDILNPTAYVPWDGVQIRMTMNDTNCTFATTNSTGNFSMSYLVPFNQSIGDWNITVRLFPNLYPQYKARTIFTGYSDAEYIIGNVTANTVISILDYTPDAFFTNDPFAIIGTLFTEGGQPVVGESLTGILGSYSFPSTPTNSTGHFIIAVSPLNATYNVSIYFNASGYYNGANFLNQPVNFLNQSLVQHVYRNDIITNNWTNPRPVNTTFSIQGTFTYDYILHGSGDGYIKNKKLSVFWRQNNTNMLFLGNVTTDNLGRYSLIYTIPASEPLDIVSPTTVLIRSVLDTIPPIEYNASYYIRPLVNTTVTANMQPSWRGEVVTIWGYLTEDESPFQNIPNYDVNVTLWNGLVPIDSQIVPINSTGGYEYSYLNTIYDELNYTVIFESHERYASSATGGQVLLYKNATFVFDASMVNKTYPGLTFNVNGRAFATYNGFPNRPIPSKQYYVYWNGTFNTTLSLDGGGYFNFNFPISASENIGVYTITLQLADFNQTGYNVSSNYSVEVLELVDLNINFNPSANEPIFYHINFTLSGSVTNGTTVQNPFTNNFNAINITVEIFDGSTSLYYSTLTNALGQFLFSIPAVDLQANGITPYTTNFSIDIRFSSQKKFIYNSSQTAYQPLKVIKYYQFDKDAVMVLATNYITGTIDVIGQIEGFDSQGSNYSLPVPVSVATTYDVYFNGRYQGNGVTFDGYISSFTVQSNENDTLDNNNQVLFQITNPMHPSINSSFLINITLNPLDPLLIQMHPSINYAIFQDTAIELEGNVSSPDGIAVDGLNIAVDLKYINGTVTRYDSLLHAPDGFGSISTDSYGRFLFAVKSSYNDANLDNISIIVNYDTQRFLQAAIYGPVNINFITNVYFPPLETTINGRLITEISSVVQGSFITIRGRAISAASQGIRNQPVELEFSSGQSVIVNTDSYGYFQVTVNVSGNVDSYFTFNTTMRTFTANYPSFIIVAPTDYTWILWLVPPIAIGVIFLGFMYVRYQKKLRMKKTRSYMQQKLDIVRELVNKGKVKEAISYCYHMLMEVAGRQFDLEEVKKGSTIREFIDNLVRVNNVNPDYAYPFLGLLNETLYSHHEIKITHAQEAVSMFGNLYRDITNDVEERFEL